jgi:hypothetical protein
MPRIILGALSTIGRFGHCRQIARRTRQEYDNGDRRFTHPFVRLVVFRLGMGTSCWLFYCERIRFVARRFHRDLRVALLGVVVASTVGCRATCFCPIYILAPGIVAKFTSVKSPAKRRHCLVREAICYCAASKPKWRGRKLR